MAPVLSQNPLHGIVGHERQNRALDGLRGHGRLHGRGVQDVEPFRLDDHRRELHRGELFEFPLEAVPAFAERAVEIGKRFPLDGDFRFKPVDAVIPGGKPGNHQRRLNDAAAARLDHPQALEKERGLLARVDHDAVGGHIIITASADRAFAKDDGFGIGQDAPAFLAPAFKRSSVHSVSFAVLRLRLFCY